MPREIQKEPYAVNLDQVHEFENGKFTAEASDIGFPVGIFPRMIEKTNIGNTMPFVLQHTEISEGDLLWADYFQAAGCVSLRVYND